MWELGLQAKEGHRLEECSLLCAALVRMEALCGHNKEPHVSLVTPPGTMMLDCCSQGGQDGCLLRCF